MITGGLETAGDVMTGAVIARAVEPDHGEAATPSRGICLNCGAVLNGAYCSACGQPAHVHRTLSAIGHEIAHGVFHFEGKLWRTLPMLALFPGDLTRRYIHGERAKFVSPLALFLFSVFLMFAVFESVGGPLPFEGRGAAFESDIRKELKSVEASIDRLERERIAAAAARKPLKKLDDALADARAEQDTLRTGAAIAKDGTTSLSIGNDSLSIKNSGLEVDTGSPGLNARIRDALDNPKLLLYKLQSSAYKFSWALIPLSLPFMWLMFAWRREYRMYDHSVFITYSLAFVTLLLITMALISAAGESGMAGWLLILIPVHFARQLKQAYRLKGLSVVWRTFLLLLFATLVLLLFAGSLLALGLMG